MIKQSARGVIIVLKNVCKRLYSKKNALSFHSHIRLNEKDTQMCEVYFSVLDNGYNEEAASFFENLSFRFCYTPFAITKLYFKFSELILLE
jgi:hypothetical protein